MALPKLFNLITWHNNTTPAINEDNLNAMSQAIDDIDDRVIGLAGTIMEDVPQIQEDLEILEPAIENIDSNVERAETAADDAEDSAETAEYWANVSNPPIPVVKDFANVITVDDAIPKAATDVKVKVEAVQDLHGYTKPWVGGAGKNLLPLVLSTIKSLNTHGTWSGNSFAFNGITYTILTDSDGNITGIRANGTASGRAYIYLCDADFGSADINFDATVNGYTYSGTLDHNKRFVYYNGGSKKVYILIDTGEVCSNIVFYPQRELGTTATAFEPYSNICPISGFTEAKVTRTGKNLFKSTATTSSGQGVTWTVNDDGTITPSGTASGYAHISAGEALVKSSFGKVTVSGLSGATNIVYDLIRVMDKDNNELANFGNSVSTNVTIDLSNYPKAHKIFVELKRASNAAVGGIIKPQIELGDTATPYEPYTGTDYIIDLDGTRYGATLDVDSGVMTVDKGFGTVTSVTNGYAQGGKYIATNVFTDAKKPASDRDTPEGLISNRLESVAFYNLYNNSNLSGVSILSASGHVVFAIAGIGTQSDLNTYLASNPLQICYPLATPITVQLTPTEVQMLQGYNVLSANSGDVYLEYDASMIQRIANEKLDISTFKSVVASSSDFADFKTKVAAL